MTAHSSTAFFNTSRDVGDWETRGSGGESTPESVRSRGSVAAAASRPARVRSVSFLVEALDELALSSPNLIRNSFRYERNGEEVLVPRYIFMGPRSGGVPIRLGIFAGIHGDEPEGSHALVQFIRQLELQPELAHGYLLFFYPVCNPVGYETHSRFSQSGRDLNREFWNHSHEPEVRMLEEDLRFHGLQGIVSLHSDDTSDGLYGFVRGATLSKYLLNPALAAASTHLPRNTNSQIDGFPASNGILYQGYEGILSPPHSERPRPFEIVFETPALASAERQQRAFLAALHAILAEYRKFISFGADL